MDNITAQLFNEQPVDPARTSQIIYDNITKHLRQYDTITPGCGQQNQ